MVLVQLLSHKPYNRVNPCRVQEQEGPGWGIERPMEGGVFLGVRSGIGVR